MASCPRTGPGFPEKRRSHRGPEASVRECPTHRGSQHPDLHLPYHAAPHGEELGLLAPLLDSTLLKCRCFYSALAHSPIPHLSLSDQKKLCISV